MAKKRAKTTLMFGEKKDRISKLPDTLIIRILSFLSTKDAISTCLVSKRWKLMWYCVPKLSFSDSNLKVHPKMFYSYVDNYLEHRKEAMYFIPHSPITSFKLQMNYSYKSIYAGHLDKWLAFIVEKKVKEIDLCVNSTITINGDIHYYPLPKTLAVNSRYLTILNLDSVELDSRYLFSFPSLKTLSLAYVRLGDNGVVDNLLMGSPSLERLQLHFFCLSSDPQLSINIQHSLSLKFLEIILSKDLVERIELINLESLILVGVSFHKIKLYACKAIRFLSLTCCWGMEESSSFEYFISSLPLLENLAFYNGPKPMKLKQVEISNQHLKQLYVDNPFDDEMSVVIKSTPNLTKFAYVGGIKFSVSIESSNLLSGVFVIKKQHNYDTNWFINLMKFLMSLKCSWKCIDIHVESEEDLIFPAMFKRLFRSPLVNSKLVRFFTECKPERESDLKDALQWISPTFSVMKSHVSKSVFKFF
ncbi:putative F-box/LRR-repeat protein At4g15060 [Cannabis sativa]|uniref:putative F-box/LRR-repeat protein At4g15060 n=1 Tax=Cannabis sativa TaxID=3483 RepID=UPI0029C9F52A|nr:putative F-box/LRR-repeat protein At4g15060 [Cannabis sativa]XP_060967112.1 putative F-box/LRR-repeat protein At4g15060 [Cannabis sativa]